MKIEILTGQITGSNAHKWWAEAKGTNSQGEDISMGVQMTNSTEEETIISLIRHVIRGPKFFKNDPDLQIIGDKYDDPDYEEKMAKDLPK